MNNHVEIRVLPELRFPEFNQFGNWDVELFNEVFSFKPTYAITRENLNYTNGSIKNIHYGDIHTKFNSLFDISKENVPFVNSNVSSAKFNSESFCKEGDLIFADASEDINDIGKCIEIVHLNNENVISGLHTILARQKFSKLTVGFSGYLFFSTGIRLQIQREAQGAKVLGLSSSRLANINVYFPKLKAEQQKIADCLSSIDELIVANTQKLEALKVHKKGLMQQLFPAEGESIPRLRFREFLNNGDWIKCTFKEVFSIYQGFAFSSLDSESKGVRWLKITDVGIQCMKNDSPSYLPSNYKNKYKKYLVGFGDYVIALTRPILDKKLKLAKIDMVFDQSLLNQRVGKIVSNQVIQFIYYLLQTSRIISTIEKNISGNDPPNLSSQQIDDIETFIPQRVEQQKIADCLSSLDDLISEQCKKVEALKSHKKGLMQQLFPTF